MVAFAAQMSMGSSWRVGVVGGETGDLVSGGLYRFSRNPTFVGQAALLAVLPWRFRQSPYGHGLASVPLVCQHAGPVRRGRPARVIIGPDYDRYTASVPRWIRHEGQDCSMTKAMLISLIAAAVVADQLTRQRHYRCY